MVMLDSGSGLVLSLNHLIVTDYDAIEAYEAAIERVTGDEDRRTLRSFLADHQRHIEKLSELVRQEGDAPADHADLKRLLTKGKVVVGGLMGEEAVFRAMLSNEALTNDVYEHFGLPRELPSSTRLLLAHCLDDERRHREWLERRLTMTPKGEPVFPPLTG
jgi:rubrerythrin